MERRMFTMADANQDGQVTEAEATQAALTRFDKVDTNKDGTISAAEHNAAREKMRAAWKAKKAR
jgi:Ca2+-binding EF-hand superfamily protein